ncbi:MAG TPA: pyridoxal phosphate-dependent aminotransferase [Trebonia sp.]|nr:pyridoxal phosphate-dependent aminotransferase [Trebonia sp.]
MTGFQLAERMRRLGTESAFELLARAKALEATGRTIIHLEIGEPDFPTAAHIRAAAVEALAAGHTHYVPAPGIPALREGVAAFLERTGRLRVPPDRVVITPGAKPVMFFTILALAGPGDEVLYPDPGFPMYESITSFAGATPVPVPVRESNGFRIDTAELKRLITPRSKLLIINSPHNPCGSALTREDCAAIADLALRHDLVVLSDEVYWAIRYGAGGPPGPGGTGHASVLEFDGMADRTILLDGWSKTYAMTGWRLGFGVFPAGLVEPVTRLAINSVSCTSAFSQYAALAALDGPWTPVEEMVAEFRRRRDIVVAGLNDIPGITCAAPQGAFYAFANVSGTGLTSAELETRLLRDAGVAALAGTAFGAWGEGFMRLSYANSIPNIRAALDAIKTVVT